MLAKKIVYSKIHSAIGISKAGISGGGSLPSHVDRFFEAIDIKVQNGYGLTESSPVVAARRPTCNDRTGDYGESNVLVRDYLGVILSASSSSEIKQPSPWKTLHLGAKFSFYCQNFRNLTSFCFWETSDIGAKGSICEIASCGLCSPLLGILFMVLGSIGHPLPYTEMRVVDAETDEVLPAGSKGIVEVRGPQVMRGYYKNPLATEQSIDKDGWLTTGDIGWIAPHHSVGRSRHSGGVVVLEGRAKDTIVLLTGENVEPSELEEAAMRSSLIQQIVVIGQDQRRLGAIIVPNKEETLVAAKQLSVLDSDASELSKEKMSTLLYDELRKWTSECSFQIGPILVVDEPFTCYYFIQALLQVPYSKNMMQVITTSSLKATSC
ncbi:unnamed protein product [Ilex paraguariensis]|uniref:AMP-dependent synthetase/ligase domain-containing protein n=1 Tax=Ilex paraguariensis TaxID=185542 RepID=A0ABC8RVX3_9AQUA